jgi:glycosyltransferase involved in cell wall biosynthesis
MKVSVLILTYNEQINLLRCLEALAWCSDIVVVDSGSTDQTINIAQSFGARILIRKFDNFAEQRNFGLENGEFRNDWILHLDADEVVTPALQAELENLVPSTEISAYRLPSKLMLFNRWLRYAGMYPTYQVRLGHRDQLRFKQVGHGQREDLPSSAVATINEPYLHYNFSHGISAWLIKHVRYAEDEAAQEFASGQRSKLTAGDFFSGQPGRRRFVKSLAASLPLVVRPIARFIYIMVICQGIRDGRAGLAYGVMLSVYEGMIAVFGYSFLLRGDNSSSPTLISPDNNETHNENRPPQP